MNSPSPIQQFLKQYQDDSFVKSIAQAILPIHEQITQIKGISGSLASVLPVTIHKLDQAQTHIFILEDREEAAYFFDDLENLLEQNIDTQNKTILFFPTSYKRPYHFEEIENANVLERTEVLNQVNQIEDEGKLIVTYPEALIEKVVSQRTLLANTFTVNVSEEVGIELLEEMLQQYEFDSTDFVYEAGQYAIRGGIVDIFSFSNELPYRLDFFGDEVESIRIFNPETQLSLADVKQIAIIPNLQSKVLEEVRDSFFSFLPHKSNIWFKNYKETVSFIDKSFEKTIEEFDKIIADSNSANLISEPSQLFETSKSFEKSFQKVTQIEFGKYFRKTVKGKEIRLFDYPCSTQPSFGKKFDLLSQNINENTHRGVKTFIAAESTQQLDKIATLFLEINPNIKYEPFKIALQSGFYDANLNIACYTDHQIFDRYHRFKSKKTFSKAKQITLKEFNNLQVGDYITHIDYGIGRFAGLGKVATREGKEQEAIRMIYRDNDVLYVSIHALHKIARYSGKDAGVPSLSKLGSQEWEKKKTRVKSHLKDMGRELIQLYAKRKAIQGFACKKDDYMQIAMESSFLYEDTPDQAKAAADVKLDMEKQFPMDRLVCGDVGFGKTEVAVRAAFKAVSSGKQVAVLVPTTILASQHHRTFEGRLNDFSCRVEYVNRFRTAKELKQIFADLEEGKIDILIGTHKIVGKSVKFKNLGLLVIDEEQKFGVRIKEKLKEFRLDIDCLTLTATPIPRTLHFSLLGARDLSIINTPPPNRQPVKTELHTFSESVMRDSIHYEIRRGGQVFVVHNRIKDIDSIANIILRLVPDCKIGIAHGQMKSDTLEKVILNFINHEFDVLISTNIIENGIDIPNANTIIINNAHHFGLSDLHQMRGRVGRANRKAFCYLLSPSLIGLSADSRKRLKALESFSDLGDGFKIAMRDLDIRGAGNLLGAEQSGFISDLGFDTYHKILDDAIRELKEDEFKELYKLEGQPNLDMEELSIDCSIETDLEIRFPEEYIPSISERLRLYIEADKLKTEIELQNYQQVLQDRFGALPPQALELCKVVRLRWEAEKIGFEKLTLKKEVLKGYFVQNRPQYFQTQNFGKVLEYLKGREGRCRLKESKKQLLFIMDKVRTLDGTLKVLGSILE
jgi:transcription-repair coupling factor (superfamily II helicase)